MGKPQYLCESTGRMKFGNSKKFNIVQRTEFFMDYIKDSGEFFSEIDKRTAHPFITYPATTI